MRRRAPEAAGRARAWLGMLLAWLALLLAAPAVGAGPAARGEVLVLDLAGPVNPVSARYVASGIAEAARRDARLVVLRLDTPGGLDGAMRDMVRAILASPVPVAVHVAPAGARAASAGMFLVLAAHVAAMAPNTTIGAAHPVGGGGEAIEGPMGDKVTNDAAAYARALAAQRGRDAAWAEQAVRRSVSLAADEAARRRVVDLVATDGPALLAAIDGRRVTTAAGPRVLATRGAPTVARPMSRVEAFLLAISSPAIALLLLNVGLLGVVFELQNPGAVVPGVVGVICLLLGAFALGMLPVNGVGVALLVFGLALLAAELFVPSYGVLAVGGVAAIGLGAMMLFRSDAGELALPVGAILGITLPFAALIMGAVALGLRAQRARVATGAEDLIGRRGVARGPLAPAGVVFVEGELWRATAPEGEAIAAGEPVEVAALDGLTLRVRRPGAPSP